MLYDRVKAISKEKKLTLMEIEKRCEFAQGSISRWKTVKPSYDKVFKVAEVLGVTIHDLVGD